MNPTEYIKTLSAVLLGFLLIWIGVTGRLGSLLGAFITPAFMVDETANSDSTGTSNSPFAPGGIFGSPTGTITDKQVAQYAYNAGVKDTRNLATATAIALAESGGNTGATNPSGATGLWQILLSAHPQYTKTQMLDPQQNAAAMYAISSSGSNWCPWATYNTNLGKGGTCNSSGTYTNFLTRGYTAAGQVISGTV